MLVDNSGLYFAEYQVNKKEVLPAWVTPPFLLCKDNTFLSEMQIPIFGAGWGNRTSFAKK